MSLFNLLETILTKKNIVEGSKLKNLEPFIIQRYLSFINNKVLILIINNFINSKKSLFADKERFYLTCLNFVPTMSNRFIPYIKKSKAKKDHTEKLKVLACTEYRISRKELDEYLQVDSNLLKEFENALDLFKK